MTPDEKKAEELSLLLVKQGRVKEDDRLAVCLLVSDALTEARQEVAKQKDERIAELEAELKNLDIERKEVADAWVVIKQKIIRLESTKAELEKRVKELEQKVLELEMSPEHLLDVNAIADERDRLKAENEVNKSYIEQYQIEVLKLRDRLCKSLGALKEAVKEFDECAFHFETLGKGAFKNTVRGIRESVARWNKILTLPDNARLLEREKALEETKKLYDEAMSICCEHFGFVKFGSVADCLKGLVERDKLRDAAIAQMANCNQHEFQSCLCHKMALEAHEKEGGV